jgi:uncharacterized RDD family membrane protein YckC
MSATHFCNKCGTQNDAAAQFCSRCGAPFNAAPSPTPAATSAIPSAVPAGYPAPAPYPAVPYVPYAGFWIRFIAAIVDFFIIRVVLFPLKAMFGLGSLVASGFGMNGFHHGMALPYLIFGGGVLGLITIGASWLYEALMESSSYQATLGKMIFGMKVTDLYGNRIDFARATGRHFAKIISALILCIGFIMVGFTERKQGLHDIIAGTLVRRT